MIPKRKQDEISSGSVLSLKLKPFPPPLIPEDVKIPVINNMGQIVYPDYANEFKKEMKEIQMEETEQNEENTSLKSDHVYESLLKQSHSWNHLKLVKGKGREIQVAPYVVDTGVFRIEEK